jgi:hypothetical protein
VLWFADLIVQKPRTAPALYPAFARHNATWTRSTLLGERTTGPSAKG